MKNKHEIQLSLEELPPVVKDHVLSLSLRDNCPPAVTMVSLLRVAAQRQLAPAHQPQPEGAQPELALGR